MSPRDPYPFATMIVHVLASLALFVGFFLTIFWMPALLLSLFVIAYAADSTAVTEHLDRRRRMRAAAAGARLRRGGWVGSVAGRP